jgi:hypothetical protein
LLLRDDLGDESAKRKPKQIDLAKSQRADECGGARSNPQIRATYQRKMLALVRKMSEVLDAGPDRKQRAWSIIAMMVGAVAIAQAMPDDKKADQVLDSALQTATALIAAK